MKIARKIINSDLQKLSQPMNIGRVTVPNRVFMAPMSGITDQPFRARGYHAGAGLAVSEMVASGELARGRQESQRRIMKNDNGIQSVQLAGREAKFMADAAKIAEQGGADIIDINMGCPAKKVTGGYSGSALMRDPDHALSLIRAVCGSVSVPVTLKIRLGWCPETINAPLIARMAKDAGISMVTVHGRTREQFYKGEADWRSIHAVRDAISIPLVANGDVQSVDDAALILNQSGADAIMIGRGHYGQPWLAGMIARQAGYVGGKSHPSSRPALLAYILEHYRDMLTLYGEKAGLRQARKHLGWYLDRHVPKIMAGIRRDIMTSNDPKQVEALLCEVFHASENEAVRRVA